MDSLRILGGLVLLFAGGDLVVRGASNLARAVGVPNLIIGLTIVAAGTSAPELVVSCGAVLAGNSEVALGNIVGSNICNVLLILGCAALLSPLVVNRQLIRWDVPIMIGASWLMWQLARDGVVSREDGVLLLGVMIGYQCLLIGLARRQTAAPATAAQPPAVQPIGNPTTRPLAARLRTTLLSGGVFAIGLVLLILGGDWLVDGAVNVAQRWGVSELVIGLTVVAVGTSLPEVVTSLVATLRGERDIAVGNVVGSNITNILLIGGAASVLGQNGMAVPAGAIALDIPIMIAATAACLPVFISGRCIERWEGGFFLFYYAAYTTFLVLQAMRHPALPNFVWCVTWVAVPITVIVFAVMRWKTYRLGSPS